MMIYFYIDTNFHLLMLFIFWWYIKSNQNSFYFIKNFWNDKQKMIGKNTLRFCFLILFASVFLLQACSCKFTINDKLNCQTNKKVRQNVHTNGFFKVIKFFSFVYLDPSDWANSWHARRNNEWKFALPYIAHKWIWKYAKWKASENYWGVEWIEKEEIVRKI
jgi:hypothetical protein